MLRTKKNNEFMMVGTKKKTNKTKEKKNIIRLNYFFKETMIIRLNREKPFTLFHANVYLFYDFKIEYK